MLLFYFIKKYTKQLNEICIMIYEFSYLVILIAALITTEPH
jgi:hypothetical protein